MVDFLKIVKLWHLSIEFYGEWHLWVTLKQERGKLMRNGKSGNGEMGRWHIAFHSSKLLTFCYCSHQN